MAARKLVVYSDARKELAVFEENYSSILVDCSTPSGMKSAKDCRKEIRDARSNLEDLRKEAKAPIVDKGKVIDKEAKDIKEKLDALFAKFDDAIKAIENKKEIDAAAAVQAEKDKIYELDQREQAIYAKEIELGIREPASEPEDTDTGEVGGLGDGSSAGDDVHNSDSSGSDKPVNVETICEPHIKVAGERLAVLKKIRGLVEPSDAQPDGRIDKKIAEAHDGILADIWELVDVFQ